jgi:hypothetical protein
MENLVAQIFSFIQSEAWPLFVFLLDKVARFVLSWWWIILPALFFKKAKKFYFFFIQEKWSGDQKKEMIEIKIPSDSVKPVSAMESVFDSLWQTVYIGDPSWKEKWLEGQGVSFPISYEIASFGGEIHFFMRIPKAIREPIEAAIFAQYPSAEISTAEDYVKKVPQDIPNKEWNYWAADMRTLKKNCYPIKTHDDFETGNESVEEKRVDPLANLLEALGKVSPGEQLWIQIVTKPIGQSASKSFVKEGEAEIAKLLSRPGDPKSRKVFKRLFDLIIHAKPLEEEKKKEDEKLIPSEMKLSPGERGVVEKVEEKTFSKVNDCHIRFAFLGKRDVFFKPKLRLPFGYFSNFEGTNNIVPKGGTMPKADQEWYNFWVRPKRKVYHLARKSFRRYRDRLRWNYPFPEEKKLILSNKELATLYHFPSTRVAPAPFIERVEAKRGGAPVELPR